ncbi:MAG TPA: transposase [Dehalococcoidia bacterium]|nr:transposase [Dehalococcoidia bacterium]
MTKLNRFVLENHCYHVTSATRGREPIFADERAATILQDALQFVRRERAFVLAYAIMPDHFHALIAPRAPFTVSQVMQSLKGFASREVNRLNDTKGPIWQQSYYDRIIRDERQLADTIEYIHMNPVKDGLVARPEDYRFSSAAPDAETDLEAYFA